MSGNTFNWSYGEETGPKNWHVGFPIAKEGKRQSPIDIDTGKVECLEDKNEKGEKLSVDYENVKFVDIENTGSSWKVNVDIAKKTNLWGGVLGDDKYELWQFHAHWGTLCQGGSEHTINGKLSKAELHLVHWNCGKYETPGEAVNNPDGLAVLGMMIEVDSTASDASPHSEIEKIIGQLKRIRKAGSKADLSSAPKFDCSKFLPSKRNYFSYLGSLTTPPLLECVTWILFEQSLSVTQSQMERMETSLCFDTEECNVMCNNFRSPCPTGERQVCLYKKSA